MKSANKLAGLGVLTAISASLCCITPLLAIIAGSSGLASTFSWLEPLRPYLIGATVLVLGFAWYQQLKPQKKSNCGCEAECKKPFIQSKKFLSIVTVFAALMLAFPGYSHIFFPKKPAQEVNNTIITNNIKKAEFTIEGMTCSGCEEHVNHEVNQLNGIIKSTVSYDKGLAIVEFDSSKTNINELEKAIAKTGYSVTAKNELK